MGHHFNVKLSELLRRPVTDSEGVRIGYVEDVWLENDGTLWLVVGGNVIQETLVKLHIRPDIDLLVPSDAITQIDDDEITIRWTLFELESTCEECWLKEKERLVDAAAAKRHGLPGLQLISPRI